LVTSENYEYIKLTKLLFALNFSINFHWHLEFTLPGNDIFSKWIDHLIHFLSQNATYVRFGKVQTKKISKTANYLPENFIFILGRLHRPVHGPLQ
jgi:hypothetical protein